MELDIEKFSPTRAELAGLVEKSKTIDLSDPFDDMQLAKVKVERAGLRSTRTAITRRGKELRDDALAFQRAVIATERDLIAIIEPEEDRLAALIDGAVATREREARRDMLPKRWERIKAITGDVDEFMTFVHGKVLSDPNPITEEYLLDMDGPTFEGLLNFLLTTKNAADAFVIREREAVVREKEEQQRKEEEIRAHEEQARKEERERMESEQKEAEARAVREKEEKELRAEEDRLRQEHEAAFQAFLRDHGCNPDTAQDFKIDHHANEVVLWKKVAVFNKAEQ
ncbi:MAG TPA: hypothetical protein VGI45_24800 [Terracidiphilus sp.]|jgi:flagellar biosynthesis GTPase FlhF